MRHKESALHLVPCLLGGMEISVPTLEGETLTWNMEASDNIDYMEATFQVK